MLELAGIVILGIIAQWVAWKVKLPAILPLLIIGLLAGPLATLVMDSKLIDPDRIFEDNILHYFVSLSVGVILFEGGLTLRLRDVRNVASTIRNLLIIGPVISLLGGGLAAYYFIGLDIRVALLFGALIIVTGPTVIGPILRNVQPNKKVATILHWEGIIIDPLGALVAVLMYEFIISGAAGAQFTLTALTTFGKTILAGAVMGGFCAWMLFYLLRHKLVPAYLTNVVSLALVFTAFVGADMISAESGLLAVTLMGMILANLKIPELSAIFNFKESLTILLVSILFIILSADIEISQLQKLGWGSALVFIIVVFVLRPLTVFLSSIKSNLSLQEKIFISWIGPRGIVAAAISSLFAISILDTKAGQFPDAEYLIPLTFLIILGTVLLQGTSAQYVAKWLNVLGRDSKSIFILGAHEASRKIAKYLDENGVDVTLIDTSRANLKEALMLGIKGVEKNVLADDLVDEFQITDIGIFMALTSNNQINITAAQKFKTEFKAQECYRLVTRNEMKFTDLVRPKNILFDHNTDFYHLMELSRKYPGVNEIELLDEFHLQKVLQNMSDEAIPLFLRSVEGGVKVIPADHTVEYDEGDVLAYIGQPMEEARMVQKEAVAAGEQE